MDPTLVPGPRVADPASRTVRPCGDLALLVEPGDPGTAGLVRAALERRVDDGALGGVVDLVQGAGTVLVRFATVGDRRAATGVIERIDPAGEPATPAGGLVEIPTVYDGPDLDDVARLTGLSTREVVGVHTGVEWRVAFAGFAPGFGYLVADDDPLHVPRRDEARTSVPAGSVALAAQFSAVYPRASPGGWQLVGRTDRRLWDIDRTPPALLTPGTRVRFVGGPR